MGTRIGKFAKSSRPTLSPMTAAAAGLTPNERMLGHASEEEIRQFQLTAGRALFEMPLDVLRVLAAGSRRRGEEHGAESLPDVPTVETGELEGPPADSRTLESRMLLPTVATD